MNNYNASLNNQSQELTPQALELLLKTLNGYDVLSSDLYVLARKGSEFSTYTKQGLLSTGANKSKLWQMAMANAPVSEVDKIKNAIRNTKLISQPVQLAMDITGAGAYKTIDELYSNGKYSEFIKWVTDPSGLFNAIGISFPPFNLWLLILIRQKTIRNVPKFHEIIVKISKFIALWSFLFILRQKQCRIVPNFRKNLMQLTASLAILYLQGEACIFTMLLLQK